MGYERLGGLHGRVGDARHGMLPPARLQIHTISMENRR